MKIFRNAPGVFCDRAGQTAWGLLVAENWASIEIVEGTPEWDEAYSRWCSGKSPSDSPLWKKGVFLSTQGNEDILRLSRAHFLAKQGRHVI